MTIVLQDVQSLPKIFDDLVRVIEYFEPIARSIHADVNEDFITRKAISLADEWLDIEMGKAHKMYWAKKG